MKKEKLVLELEPKHMNLLRACAAFDGQTPEEFLRDAMLGNLQCLCEHMAAELRG